MQVLLNTDPHTDGRHETAAHVEAVIRGHGASPVKDPVLDSTDSHEV